MALLRSSQDNRRIFVSEKGVEERSTKGDVVYNKVVQWGDRVGEDERGGKARWPVVQTEEMAVQVLSKERAWGVRMSKVAGGQLQLYVLKVGEGET